MSTDSLRSRGRFVEPYPTTSTAASWVLCLRVQRGTLNNRVKSSLRVALKGGLIEIFMSSSLTLVRLRLLRFRLMQISSHDAMASLSSRQPRPRQELSQRWTAKWSKCLDLHLHLANNLLVTRVKRHTRLTCVVSNLSDRGSSRVKNRPAQLTSMLRIFRARKTVDRATVVKILQKQNLTTATLFSYSNHMVRS